MQQVQGVGVKIPLLCRIIKFMFSVRAQKTGYLTSILRSQRGIDAQPAFVSGIYMGTKIRTHWVAVQGQGSCQQFDLKFLIRIPRIIASQIG